MADDDGIRLRNVSPLGDIEVPDLNRIVEHHHEVVVADEVLAARLIDGGHFTAVGRPGPKTGEPTPEPEQGPTGEQTTDVQPIPTGAPE